MDQFPRSLYHDNYGEITVESQETMDLALSRGYKRVAPRANTIPKIKARIGQLEKELATLKSDLEVLVHDEEVATKAARIAEKMQADEAARAAADVKAGAAAEEKAAREAEAARAAAAKAKAEEEVAAAKGKGSKYK